MNTSGKKPKYIHQIYDEKVCVEQVCKQQYIGHGMGWDVICFLTLNTKPHIVTYNLLIVTILCILLFRTCSDYLCVSSLVICQRCQGLRDFG